MTFQVHLTISADRSHFSFDISMGTGLSHSDLMTPLTTNTTAELISSASLWSFRFAKQLYPRDNLVRIAAGCFAPCESAPNILW